MKCESKTASLSNLFVNMMFFKKKNDIGSEPAVDYDRFILISNGDVEININNDVRVFSHPNIVFVPSNTDVKFKALSSSASVFSLYILHDKETKKVLDPSKVFDGMDLLNYGIPKSIINNE